MMNIYTQKIGDVTYWQCERRNECKARLHTQDMEIIKRLNEHLHGPDMQKVTCLETKATIKRKYVQLNTVQFTLWRKCFKYY